jgi:hypothetical protein
MQFVGICGLRPGFLAHPPDCVGVEPAEIRGLLGREPAAAHHGLGAALLQWRVVQVGIGARRKHFERKRGGLGQIARHHRDFTCFDPLQQARQAGEIHGLGQAIGDGLVDQRVVGNLTFADEVFGARDLIGKHRADQILGPHAGELRRHLLATLKARQRERDADHPAPPRDEHRGVKHRLD